MKRRITNEGFVQLAAACRKFTVSASTVTVSSQIRVMWTHNSDGSITATSIDVR